MMERASLSSCLCWANCKLKVHCQEISRVFITWRVGCEAGRAVTVLYEQFLCEMSKIFRVKVDVNIVDLYVSPAIWENTAIFFQAALENGSSAKTAVNVVLKATDTP